MAKSKVTTMVKKTATKRAVRDEVPAVSEKVAESVSPGADPKKAWLQQRVQLEMTQEEYQVIQNSLGALADIQRRAFNEPTKVTALQVRMEGDEKGLLWLENFYREMLQNARRIG